MNKTFMPEVNPEQRLQLLNENCDKQEQTSYFKDLTLEDLDVKHKQLSDNLIEAFKLEDELAKVKKEFKDQLDPLKVARKMLAREISTGKQEIDGVLFHMANYEDNIMETYDERGEFVSARRLRPDEKQLRTNFMKKAE